MNILDRYLLTKILVPFFYCIIGFISIWLVWDMSVNLPDFISGHATLGRITRFYLLQFPSVIVLSVPIGLLLSLLYTTTQMSRRNEIISMFSAGRSLWRIFTPLIALGFVMTGILALLNYQLVPQSISIRDQLKEEIKTGHKRKSGIVSDYLFHNRKDKRLWFFSSLNWKENKASRTQIIQQNDERIVTEQWYANPSYFIPKNLTWVLENARHIKIDEEGNLISSESLPRIEIKGWNETPWKIASALMNAEFLGLPELNDYLHYNAEFSKTELAPFVTNWHYRLALPWICMVVIFIASPLGVVTGRRGIMGGVTLAIALFAGMIFSSSFFLALGKGDRIPGWLAGWAPILIFLVIGFYLFWLASTGRELPKLRLMKF